MHTNNESYFKYKDLSKTFNKQRLYLKTVCWMNPYAKIENVPIPERETTLAIFFYHGYTEHVRMHSTFLKVWIRDTSLDPDAPWGEVAARLNWMSSNQIKPGWEEVC